MPRHWLKPSQRFGVGVLHAFSKGVAKPESFRELLVWQKAMDLAEDCYRLSRRLHRDDQNALGLQLRKSSLSVPSNIAEGYGRHHTALYVNHLWIANGSSNELQTQLELAARVQIISRDEASKYIAQTQEVGRMLIGLIRSLEQPRR